MTPSERFSHLVLTVLITVFLGGLVGLLVWSVGRVAQVLNPPATTWTLQSARPLSALEQGRVREVLRGRLAEAGVRRARLEAAGPSGFRLNFPSGGPAPDPKKLLRTGSVEFRIVGQGATGTTVAAVNEQLRRDPTKKRAALEKNLIPLAKLGPAALTGFDLQGAKSQTDREGKPQIAIEFTSEGAEKFEALTRANVNKRLALVLGGKVYLAPTIGGAISGERVLVGGAGNAVEAKSAADQINTALLPVRLTVVAQ